MWTEMEIALPHMAESEYREPLIQFTLPSLFGKGTYDFYWVSQSYWAELLALACSNVCLAAVTGAIVYKCMIGQNAQIAKLIGFGILLPFWVVWPVTVYRTLDMRNFMIKFILGVTPTLSIFRLSEAMYDCCPPHVTRSLQDYVVYYASILVFCRDEDGNLVNGHVKKTIQHFLNFIGLLFVTGALQSFLSAFPDLSPFGPPVAENEWFSYARFGTWYLYANSFLHAGAYMLVSYRRAFCSKINAIADPVFVALFQLILTTYCEALTFFWNLTTGYQTQPIMKNPLAGARSPSDFWGRRWNLLVQGVLKGGVFKPVRKYYSKTTAVLATFLASGAFHEWLIYGLFAPMAYQLNEKGECVASSCYSVTYGGALVFFLWQAFIIAVEAVVGETKLVATVSKRLPLPMRTALVICLGIPFAHFFTEPYVRSDFFRHGQFGLPFIIRDETQ